MKKIALVGRPNVGKSALFNRIVGKRVAIVDEQEGVTRDRICCPTESFGRFFEAIDTGGIDPYSTMAFNEEVKQQALLAIEEADSLILVVDAQCGVTALDEEVARILLRKGKPVCVAVNKIDERRDEVQVHKFHSLGISNIIGVSAVQGYQVAELIDLALKDIDCTADEAIPEKNRVAIIGRPNVGKSTLLNRLLGEHRCAVSPLAGTTRDSIDVDLEVDGEPITLIDTAGIRRKPKEKDVIEKYAAIRTERAILRADVCVLLIDAREGMTVQEKKIAKEVEEVGKGLVILVNKWDLVKGFRMEHCEQGIRSESPFLQHCPILFISAETGRNTNQIFPLVKEVKEHMGTRISTSPLNNVVEKAMQRINPPMLQGKRLRVYYLSQVAVSPPQFVLFVNKANLMTDTYKRYLVNSIREVFPFPGCPVRFDLRGKPPRAAL